MGVNGIYGLSGSGLDIESMVKVGMMSKQNEYDKMVQKYTKNEWMKADYLELSSKITTFNSSTLSQYKMSNNMNAKSVESSDPAIKVSANSTAAIMSHSVEILGQSANAYLVGTNKMTRYNTATGEAYSSSDTESTSIQLKDVLFQKLNKTSDGKFSGTLAITDLDMEGTTRDKTDTTSADGVALDEATKFGYTDRQVSVSAHWEDSEGNEVTIQDSDLWNDYNQSASGVSHADGNWRLKREGSVGNWTYHWENYDSSRHGSYKWQPMDPFADDATDDIKESFKTFIESHSATSTNGLTWVGQHTETIKDDIESPLSQDTVAFKFTLSDGVTKDDNGEGLKKVDISFTYKELDEGATFNDLVAKINSSGLNIKATYDSVHDHFSIYNTKSGEKNNIQIELDSDADSGNAHSSLAARNFLNNLGLYQSKSGALYGNDGSATDETQATTFLFTMSDGTADSGTRKIEGASGGVKIDGVTYNDVVDNKLTVDGVTYNILDGTVGKTSTVTVTQDVEGIIDKVKSFVSEYNTLLASLYEKYDEKPNSDYKPLTQSQKDQMKDDQIEKWEKKAKAGMLYHDQTLGKVIMNMRSAVSESIEGVDGKYNSIYSLGISTTGLKGQLVLDEDKLKKALAEDSDAVYNIFAKLDSSKKDASGNVINNPEANGVAQRLGDIFVDANKLIKSRAGSSSDITEDSDLNNLLRNLQTKMSNFKKLMSSFEDALYKKYDSMESTLAKLGTQLNYIMGSFGSQ